MKSAKKILTGIMLAVFLMSLGMTAQAEVANRGDVVSKWAFNKTVQTLTKIIESKGMMVVATIDHQNMLSMVGARINGSKTIEFGKPDMGKMVFGMNPEAGLEMPAKIYVFEDDHGKVVMSYYKTNYAQYNPELAKVDEMMSMMLSEIVNEVNK